jgi:hypothetical protein
MPPESASPLQQQVDRREIRHHHIEVEVEGLLDHLSGNHYTTASLLRIRVPAEPLQQRPLACLSVAIREAPMNNIDF